MLRITIVKHRFRGHHAYLGDRRLGPGFCRLRIRPRFCSSVARNASSPSGRPVCSCKRRTLMSSSQITRARKPRQLGARLTKRRNPLQRVVFPAHVGGGAAPLSHSTLTCESTPNRCRTARKDLIIGLTPWTKRPDNRADPLDLRLTPRSRSTAALRLAAWRAGPRWLQGMPRSARRRVRNQEFHLPAPLERGPRAIATSRRCHRGRAQRDFRQPLPGTIESASDEFALRRRVASARRAIQQGITTQAALPKSEDRCDGLIRASPIRRCSLDQGQQ